MNLSSIERAANWTDLIRESHRFGVEIWWGMHEMCINYKGSTTNVITNDFGICKARVIELLSH